jgi:hypothetical protein
VPGEGILDRKAPPKIVQSLLMQSDEPIAPQIEPDGLQTRLQEFVAVGLYGAVALVGVPNPRKKKVGETVADLDQLVRLNLRGQDWHQS